MAAETDSNDFDPSELIFVTERVTPAEVSAVTAVLRGVLREESDNLRLTPEAGQSAWQRGQRGVRAPVVPGAGHWRGFSG